MLLRTAECVSPLHPDKVCDRISDAILDACLEQDPNTRAAIEVMGGHGIVTITGELTTDAYVDMRGIANRILAGYEEDYGIQVNVVEQSQEIAGKVDTGGAGDQGIMVGYATRETALFMPAETALARDLCDHLYVRWPADGKTQVTCNSSGIPTVVLASWCGLGKAALATEIMDWINRWGFDVSKIEILANPGGDWSVGGFVADTGLTGRKLAVDNYGPAIPIGGGAFSGKDPSKVDRSAAYMARKIAIDLLVEEEKAWEVKVQLAYAIGVDRAVSAYAQAIAPAGVQVREWTLEELSQRYDLSPNGIIKALDLRKPQYESRAAYGHFGVEGPAWEKF